MPSTSHLFFTAEDGAHGRELWKSDGTEAGTKLIADLYPGPDGIYVSEIILFSEQLVFITVDANNKPAVYISDGTAQATILLYADPAAAYSHALTPAGNQFYFLAGTGEESAEAFDTYITYTRHYQTELYRSDGTDSGTYVLMKWHNTEYETQEIRDPDEIELDIIEEKYYNIP